jgi:hypothetical protein
VPPSLLRGGYFEATSLLFGRGVPLMSIPCSVLGGCDPSAAHRRWASSASMFLLGRWDGKRPTWAIGSRGFTSRDEGLDDY